MLPCAACRRAEGLAAESHRDLATLCWGERQPGYRQAVRRLAGGSLWAVKHTWPKQGKAGSRAPRPLHVLVWHTARAVLIKTCSLDEAVKSHGTRSTPALQQELARSPHTCRWQQPLPSGGRPMRLGMWPIRSSLGKKTEQQNKLLFSSTYWS